MDLQEFRQLHLQVEERAHRLIKDNATLRALLEESRRSHARECEVRLLLSVRCSCGATKWNAKVDEALK